MITEKTWLKSAILLFLLCIASVIGAYTLHNLTLMRVFLCAVCWSIGCLVMTSVPKNLQPPATKRRKQIAWFLGASYAVTGPLLALGVRFSVE